MRIGFIVTLILSLSFITCKKSNRIKKQGDEINEIPDNTSVILKDSLLKLRDSLLLEIKQVEMELEENKRLMHSMSNTLGPLSL
jgi:hypothetical protein